MAFHQPHFLSQEQILSILSSLRPEEYLAVVKLRYKNKQQIRRAEQITVAKFKAFVLESMETGWGEEDIEVHIPSLGQTLIGHHDGVYWLEPEA